MTNIPEELVGRIEAGERLTDADALVLLRSRDLLTVGQLASRRRYELVPDKRVTYVVDRNINYTNICVSGCRFCAFYRPPGSPEGYVLDMEEIIRKARETARLGGTGLMLQGGLHPGLGIAYFERLFRTLKEEFPELDIHSLSPPEIVYMARMEGTDVRTVLQRLRDAGLDSLPGGGAEILVDRVRREVAPGKASSDEWIEVMRQAHLLGLRSTATMMFGHVETLEDRVEHLRRIRSLQDETGGFRAFIPWTFQEAHTALEGWGYRTTGVDYLMMVAVSRLYLDNVRNIQASWVTQGLKMGQAALLFGANDMGSTMIEENVVRSAGVTFSAGREDLEHAIRAAGFTPVQRRADYSEVLRPTGGSGGCRT